MALGSGCGHIIRTDEVYGVESTNEPRINQARISGELIPTRESGKFALTAAFYFAAGEESTGPYRCLLTAWGQPGRHKSMTVHNLTIRTESGRRFAVERHGMGRPLRFEPATTGSEYQATFLPAGVFPIDHDDDGAVFFDADLTITSARGSRRRKVSVQLDPIEEKDVRFTSVFSDEEEREERILPGS